ncbi:MAG: peptidoglycan-binding domain-containing protein [Leifsonia sp.]|uniref:peptidoglycan-binding domain-containing protein n=1 Tax=Leifsonia sp. TaxID=1870902 RepID=UPI003F81F651
MTRTPVAVGAPIAAGATVLEVDGRPLFALPGAFAFYRDLSLGMNGPDVSQLQAGLRAAGLDVSVDGSFGASTERAVRLLYERNGYAAPAGTTQGPSATSPTSSGHFPESTSGAGPSSTPTTTEALVFSRHDFMIVASLPAFAQAVPQVGARVTGETTLTVEDGAAVAIAEVAASAASQLAEGTPVRIDHGGTSLPGTVATISQDTASPTQGGDTKNAAAADVLVKIVSSQDAPFDPAWLHDDVLAEFTVKVIADSALIVPSRAVSASADGTSRVLKRQGDGSFTEVRVQETGSLDGRSAVAPLRPGELQSGDLVKVG